MKITTKYEIGTTLYYWERKREPGPKCDYCGARQRLQYKPGELRHGEVYDVNITIDSEEVDINYSAKFGEPDADGYTGHVYLEEDHARPTEQAAIDDKDKMEPQ